MSCSAPSFTDVIAQEDPFDKLHKYLAKALKGHSKEELVLNFLDQLRDVSKNFLTMSPEDRQNYATEFLQSARGVVDDIKTELLKKTIVNKIQDPKNWFPVAVVLLVLLFAFFGYKLYLSLTEKERKREEKLKAKQEKKKKK